MKITCDSEVDALYIRFIDTTVTTQHVTEGVAVDYDTAGKIAGIEILDISRQLADREVLCEVELDTSGPA
jgi:uncharacterized protein YuzE